MISKIDCRNKKSVVKFLDRQIASDILTVTICTFMSCLRLFQNLHWDTAMPDKRRLRYYISDANQKSRKHKAVLYWKVLNVFNHPDCQQTCFRNHLPHQQPPTSRQGHDLRSSRTSLSLFFLAGNIQLLSKRWQNYLHDRDHLFRKHCTVTKKIAVGIFCNCLHRRIHPYKKYNS